MASHSQTRSGAERAQSPSVLESAAVSSPDQARARRAQALTGNAALTESAGLTSSGPGVDAAALLHGDEVLPTDIPGVLYSNTSETDLNQKADWMARLGFDLATTYEATVTLDDLILAGAAIRAPTARAVGPVRVPTEAKTDDPGRYDFIETPAGAVREKGAQRFPLRGGAGVVGQGVALRFANNGALNLARLARSAYELATAKGVTVSHGKVDYHGQTFALGCTVQMGNDVDAEGARAYGYVGEFDLKWILEKVEATEETLAEAVTVALGRGIAGRGALDPHEVALHPAHDNANNYQTSAMQEVATDRGPMQVRRPGVRSIDWNQLPTVGGRKLEAGPEQGAWLTDAGAIAAKAQARLAGAWAPKQAYGGHPTFIPTSPDFVPLITACIEECAATHSYDRAQLAPILARAVQAIGQLLLKAPMEHPMLSDPELLARLEKANRGVIAQAFGGRSSSTMNTELTKLPNPKAPPVTRPSEAPVKGAAPNGEGLVVLRDWSSRDGE